MVFYFCSFVGADLNQPVGVAPPDAGLASLEAAGFVSGFELVPVDAGLSFDLSVVAAG